MKIGAPKRLNKRVLYRLLTQNIILIAITACSRIQLMKVSPYKLNSAHLQLNLEQVKSDLFQLQMCLSQFPKTELHQLVATTRF